jgi:hypothetical protein
MNKISLRQSAPPVTFNLQVIIPIIDLNLSPKPLPDTKNTSKRVFTPIFVLQKAIHFSFYRNCSLFFRPNRL